jgi:hypothetical protein
LVCSALVEGLEAGRAALAGRVPSGMLAMALPGEERFAAGDACGVGEFDALLLCELPLGDELFFKLDEAAAEVAPASADCAGAGADASAGAGAGALGVFISAAEYLSALARSSSGGSSGSCGSGGSSGGSCGVSGASLSTSLISVGEVAERCAVEAAPLAPLPACWSSSPSADAPARRKRSVSSYCEASSACGGSSVSVASSCSGEEALVASAPDAAAPAKRQRRRGLGADETRGLSPGELRVLKKRHKMERNRQLAHESRERRKSRLAFLEDENRRLASRVRELEAECARLGRGSSEAPPAPALALRKGKGGEPLVQGAAAMAATMSMVLFADGSGSAAGSAPGAAFGAGLASHWAAGWGAQLWLLRIVLPLGQAAVLLLATLAALVLGVLYVRLGHACLSSGPVALVNGVGMAAASPRGGARVVSS